MPYTLIAQADPAPLREEPAPIARPDGEPGSEAARPDEPGRPTDGGSQETPSPDQAAAPGAAPLLSDAAPEQLTAGVGIPSPPPPDISIKHMFLGADPLVQGVMILLFLASLASWVVIFEKLVLMRRVGREIRRFREAVGGAGLSLKACPGFTRSIAEAGLAESRDHSGNESRADYRARLESVMRVTLAGHLDRLEHRVLFLATVAASSPFIGLFGTVWGIMNSFIGIAASGETTLAVVAPGIAEALFATGMGLAAAIPAVIAFNKISNAHKRMAKEALAAISLLGNQLARRHYHQDAERSGP